ncbi:hypothetical protein ACH4PU_08600 [Streptomyces sp. NPDC021100]|uniref:hypothetical protein n=1 Tax=Streptomyces sp. NPDC021100 TaxID=3365114 RepID=UPI0037981BE1
MNRTYAAGALTLLATGFAAVTAVPAHATSVVGFGNAVIGNSCAGHGGHHRDRTAAARSGGALTGQALTAGGSSPVNQCADLGLPTGLDQMIPVSLTVPGAGSVKDVLLGFTS